MAKPSKTPIIQEFISMNNGKIFSTKEMCKEIGVSLPTLLAYIKNNPDTFTSMSYGVYKIEVNAQATY
jgi:hypothetical protein